MRVLVLLFALLMPAVAWLSNTGTFGPDNGTVSNQYPTLLVAAGYAFAIWGLIFLLDLVFAVQQLRARDAAGSGLDRARLPAALGFALTAAWMPVFSQQLFWLALAIIWGALASMVVAALRIARDPAPVAGQGWWAAFPIALHAGWLSLAAFLNTAQVIVAYRLLPTDAMLGWSLVLFALAAALLLAVNQRLRGSAGYTLAGLWGLAGVYMKQSTSALAGADTAAWVAVAIAIVLLAQTLWLRMRR
ncbi:MAG: hypothetical protein NDI66_06855 [Pseudomonas sp.]|nr:hypothetical protein [Pseudomonas sp.]